MGQDLFYPPNVGGWSEGRSLAFVARDRGPGEFCRRDGAGELWNPTHLPPLEELPGRHVKTADLDGAVAWLAGLLWGHAPPAVVAEVVAAAQECQARATVLVGRGAAVGQARISIVLTHSSLERLACSPDAGF